MHVIKVTGRGTGTRKAEISALNWAGDNYRKIQQDQLAKIGKNLILVQRRGGKTISLKDLPEPRQRRSTEGMTRVTNRGTGSRRSTDAGTA